MPLYEFQCERCGSRFEVLVEPNTPAVECRECGAEGARRVLSAPGSPFKVVKALGQSRRQERSNAQLRARTKQRFKEARRRTRQAGGGT